MDYLTIWPWCQKCFGRRNIAACVRGSCHPHPSQNIFLHIFIRMFEVFVSDSFPSDMSINLSHAHVRPEPQPMTTRVQESATDAEMVPAVLPFRLHW